MTRRRVGILGASGYGGAELIDRLIKHPEVALSGLASRQYEGQAVETCWPQFAGLLEQTFQSADETIEACEVLFCATPHGATAPLVKQALDAGKRVIDLSADFRLHPEDYARWYGQAHPYPELFVRARYGLVELHREELYGAELIASPGCNATAANLALAPLAAHGLLGETVIANILTGVSGAGRAPGLGLHYAELNENARAYKVAGAHRHTAEIEATLGRLKTLGKRLRTHESFECPKVTFNPHLVPMTRGILATCYTEAPKQVSETEVLTLYQNFYEGDVMVQVQTQLPQTKAVSGSDRSLLSVRLDARSGHIIAFAAIDNLGKGAAGQAVQNFNVAQGFKETLGLRLEGRWP